MLIPNPNKRETPSGQLGVSNYCRHECNPTLTIT